MKNVLYLNHYYSQCGVYQFGKDQAKALKFVSYHEISSLQEFNKLIDESELKIVILNHHPATMPYINREVLLSKKEIGAHFFIMVHDGIWDFGNEFAYIFPDPTYKADETNRFMLHRAVPQFKPTTEPLPNTVGSFGFGFDEKDYVGLVGLILKDIPNAKIRLHMPASTFVDPTGSMAARIAGQCRQVYPNADLEVNYKFLNEQELIDWLGQNSLNIFNYRQDRGSCGLASVIDWAVAANRPFGVNRSIMFRHIWSRFPELVITENSLDSIINKGNAANQELLKEWSSETVAKQLEDIIYEVLRASW